MCARSRVSFLVFLSFGLFVVYPSRFISCVCLTHPRRVIAHAVNGCFCRLPCFMRLLLSLTTLVSIACRPLARARAQSMARFPELFDALDAAREQLKYSTYGVSLTTLEVCQ